MIVGEKYSSPLHDNPEFFKYQQGYVSRALATAVVGVITNILDSSDFHKYMGGAQSFLPDGCRAFWREAQHLGHVPTCTLRGVLESHTTPESLEMTANLLTKQSGSHLHDSQVHTFDAVGHPVYHRNRNATSAKEPFNALTIGAPCLTKWNSCERKKMYYRHRSIAPKTGMSSHGSNATPDLASLSEFRIPGRRIRKASFDQSLEFK